MCMSSAVNQGMMRGIFKKAMGSLVDAIGKPEEAEKQSSKPSPAVKKDMPKQKRRIRPSRLMRSGGGNRSFLEGGQ